MKHDPNDPFCPCEDCMTVAEKVEQELRQSKPTAINRQDPAWAQFAAAAIPYNWNDRTTDETVYYSADFADAMIRERDRRDREERP